MKKIAIALFTLILAFSFCACTSTNGGTDSSAGSEPISSEVSSEIGSEGSSEAGSEASGPVGSGEESSNGGNGAIDANYTLDNFKKMYSDAGFTVTNGTYSDDMDALEIKNDKYDDDVTYQVVVFASQEEAEKAREKETTDDREAIVKGNALILYDKGYEHHDEYIEPFNNIQAA